MTKKDLPGLFEGLSAEQAKQLSAQILPTLFELREKITNPSPNGTGNQPKGARMTEDIELTEEERGELRTAYDGIIAKRAAAAMQPRIEAYKKEMLAARGKPHILQQIRERARQNGVPVDQVDFS